MSPAKVVVAIAIVVLLCFAALGFSARRDNSSVGDPQNSFFGLITRMFPQQKLTPDDVRTVSCFDAGQDAFVFGIGGCAFAVPDGVRTIDATWAGGNTTVQLKRDTSLTQTYRSTDDPQDPKHPSDVSMPVFGNGTVATMQCGSGTCKVLLR